MCFLEYLRFRQGLSNIHIIHKSNRDFEDFQFQHSSQTKPVYFFCGVSGSATTFSILMQLT